MAVTGDIEKLGLAAKAFRRLASGEARRVLSLVLANEALELIDEGFSTGKAPDGSAWAPLKHRSGQPLRDTGRLQRGWFVVQATGTGFTVGNATAYAAHHQYGAPEAGIPARPMVPTGKLPPAWNNALDEAAREFLEDLFGNAT